jgi:hypothetical protein
MRIISDKKRLKFTIKLNDGTIYKSLQMPKDVFFELKQSNLKTYEWMRTIRELNYFKNDK